MIHPTEQAIMDVADSIGRKNRRIRELETEVERLQAIVGNSPKDGEGNVYLSYEVEKG